MVLVHESIKDQFLKPFVDAIDGLKMGLPWEQGVSITPLPEPDKPGYLKLLIDDALHHGAQIINPRGGKLDRTFVAPTVLYPVNDKMKIYHEEQFGPLIPIRTFKQIDEVYDYIAASPYGQQASVFSTDPAIISNLVDVLVNQVARVNINKQCQRGPDTFPFTGRKDSAYGTLSVFDALRVFSIRSFVATSEQPANTDLLSQIIEARKSSFLRMDYLF